MAQMILRLLGLKDRMGLSRSSIYKQVDAKLLPRPIRLSARAVGWPLAEIDAVLAARIAGRTDDEIRKLVKQLEASRQDAGIAAA